MSSDPSLPYLTMKPAMGEGEESMTFFSLMFLAPVMDCNFLAIRACWEFSLLHSRGRNGDLGVTSRFAVHLLEQRPRESRLPDVDPLPCRRSRFKKLSV